MLINRRTALFSTAFASSFAFNIGSGLSQSPEVTLRMANDTAEDHPMNARVKVAIAKVREESGGRLDIKLFPYGQLGSAPDMFSQVRTGALDMCMLSGAIVANLVPVTSIYGVAFGLRDYDAAWKAMDGELGSYLREQITKAGLHSFEKAWDNGYRQTYTTTKPIVRPDDFVGLKLRVPQSPIYVSTFKALGASPTALSWPETFSALQTRIVDGLEISLVLIELSKYYEAVKYCSLTNHMWDAYFTMVNRRVWDRLPSDLKAIMERNINGATEFQRADMVEQSKVLQTKLEGHGLIFNQPDTEPFRETLRKAGYYSEWRGKFGEQAWSILEKYSGRLA
jgi:tripartite ATP-independent transporter DctP family solute receptor